VEPSRDYGAWTYIVTAGAVTAPTVNRTGTGTPGRTPAGIWTLIWSRPANPGAAPLYCTMAGIPSIWTETGNTNGAGPLLAMPSTVGGVVWPPPVAKIRTTEPLAAGEEAELGLPS